MALTREDILKDKELVSTLSDYGFKRNGESYNTKEEAIDGFLEDYRALQSNTVSAGKFINFVSNLNDDDPEEAEFKQRLGKLYKKVDEEVDEVFGDTSTGQKLEAVGEYLKYTVIDPINLLGLGAGKLIAGAAGRAALKPLLSRAFASKAGAIATPAITEAAIGAGQEALVQTAEKDIGAREGMSAAEIGTAGALSGVVGGVAGAIGSKFAGGKRIAETEKKIAENLEDTVQGRGAKLDNLKNAVEKTGDDYEGSYVFLKDSSDIGDEYDSMGKVIGFNKDNQTATIEFIGKKDETGTITRDIDLGEAKLATEKQVKDSTESYIKENKKFLDKSDPNFEEFKKALGANGIDLDTPRFKRVTTPEFSNDINQAVMRAIDESPRLKARIDPRKRVTSQIADLVRDDEFVSANPDIMNAFIREGIDPEDVATFIISESSIVGQKLGGKGLVAQDIQKKFIPALQKATSELTPEQRGLLDIIKEEKLIEERMANKFNVGVDIWRSFLISQPATTMRNIIGSALRVPGQTIEGQLDNFFKRYDTQLLGYDTQVDSKMLNRGVLDLSKNLFNPEDAIPLARLVAKDFSKVDKLLFQVFDDYMPVKREELGFLGKSLSTASNYLNVLNRQQDRAIKSASFLSELDAQIKTARNRGIITDTNVSSIDDVLQQNKLNLLNDEMVSKALDFAYKMTYQTKRAGDDLAFGGALVNNVQKSLNNNSVLKTVIPFPNFLINSLVYTTNRAGFGAIKMAKSGRQLMKRNVDDAVKNRAELNKAQAEFEQLMQNPKAADPTRKAQLEDTIQKLSKDFAEAERSLVNLKRGMTETIEGAGLLSAALAMRSQLGGSEWYLIKDGEGQERDFRPIFPLTPFLFFADLILKSFKDEPITQEYVIGGSEAVLGVTVRAGALGNFARNGYQRLSNMDNDPLAAKDFGKSLGSVLGYFLGGYATPTRPIQDLIQSATGSEQIERRMQKNAFGIDFEIEAPVFQGMVDEVAKNVFRGTPFEKAVFADTPEFISGTSEQTPRPVDAPIQKQFSGATVAPRKTVVGEELSKLGIPEYKTGAGTRVPEYNYAYKKALGEISTKIVEPFLNDPEYFNKPPKEKRRILDNIFFGKSSANVPPRLLKALRVDRLDKTFNNVRQLANAMVKAARPNLHYLANFRKGVSSDDFSDAAEIYKQRYPQENLDNILTYVDEQKNKEASDKQKAILEEIKSIATKRGSLGQRDFTTLQKTARRYNMKTSSGVDDLKFAEGGFVEDIDPEFVSDETTEFSDIDPEFVQEYKVEDQMDELGLAPEGRLIPRSSNKVPLTTKDSKSVTEEEVKNLANTLTQIGVDMSPVGTYEAIKNLPQNVKDSVNEYDKGNIGKAALLMVLGTAGAIPGMPSNVIGKAVKGKPVKGKVISADEVVADDATKMYAKSIEDADRFDNVEDWQAEVKVIKKSNNVDLSVRTPELEASAKRLINKEIPREEHLRSIDKHKPVRGFDELPRQPTDKAVVFALNNSQREKGLFQLPEEVTKKLNVKRSPLKVGDPVQGRLDIPAYLDHDTWIVTLLSPQIKNAKGNRTSIYGKAIHYAPDSKKGHVEFKAAEGLGQKIATGHNKTPYATVMGTVKDLDSERIRKKASEILNDPEWVQLSFDPRRQTSFYVRKGADGLPVHTPIASADEVIQIGPLVLAKNAVAKTKKDGTPWTDLNRGGSINRQMVALGL